MAQFNKINVQIGGVAIMAESISINESSPNTPLYILNNSRNVNNTPTAVKTSLNINYFPESQNEPILAIISGWKNNTTGNLRSVINIGDSPIIGYLNSYSLDIAPNQIAKAKVTYECFASFLTPFSNQFSTDTGLYNLTQNTGLIHYWNTKFLSNGNTFENTDILQCSYNFNAEIKPNYKLGSPSPSQVSIVSAVENFNIISQSQPRVDFLAEDFSSASYFDVNIDSLRLSGFAGSSYIDIPLTGFSLQASNSNIAEGQLILFNSEYNKYY